MKTLIYLASPYTHNATAKPDVIEQRFDDVCKVASILFHQGYLVFSPIAHTHPIKMRGGLPGGWEFYAEYDKRMMDACDELWVLTIPGYRESVGIKEEIQYATETEKPVRFVDIHGDIDLKADFERYAAR